MEERNKLFQSPYDSTSVILPTHRPPPKFQISSIPSFVAHELRNTFTLQLMTPAADFLNSSSKLSIPQTWGFIQFPTLFL
jgi:hypothetical protein